MKAFSNIHGHAELLKCLLCMRNEAREQGFAHRVNSSSITLDAGFGELESCVP